MVTYRDHLPARRYSSKY